MKYLRLFEDYIDDENYYGVDIPKISIEGEFYHGTTLIDDNFISHLEIGYSDYDAIWFSWDESIAESFSSWHYTQDEGIKIIFQVELSSDNIAFLSDGVVEELKDFYGRFDIREAIPDLVNQGFDGWKTTGSIDEMVYDDFAIFDDDLIDIKSCKLKIDGEWTEYMNVNDAEKLYMEWYNNQEK